MNINLVSPFNILGYGQTGIHCLDALVKLGHNVAATPIGNIEADPKFHSVIKESISKPFFYDAPCIKIFHQNQMAQMVGRGPKIGFPIFELEDFTDDEKHHLNYLDKILVASKWAKEVVLRNLQCNEDKVFVCPLGVDTDVFYPRLKFAKRSIFSILSIGKWEIRKNHDNLIDIFLSAFTNVEDVELLCLHDNIFQNEQQKSEWESLYTIDKRVKLISHVQTSEEVADIINHSDIGICISRAEGWDMPAHEFLACGKYVIATDCTAHTEFLNSNNSFLISHSNEYEEAWDGVWFRGQGRWMKWTESQTEQTIYHLKYLYNRWVNNELGINHNGIDTSINFSWINTCRSIVEAIL